MEKSELAEREMTTKRTHQQKTLLLMECVMADPSRTRQQGHRKSVPETSRTGTLAESLYKDVFFTTMGQEHE